MNQFLCLSKHEGKPTPGSRAFWHFVLALFVSCLSWALTPAFASSGVLQLAQANPHYFVLHGRPTVLVGSSEHYGAVFNADFDYVRYLDELQAHGLNNTRVFAGTYREVPSSFGITENTLAPRPNRYACPWSRGPTPGSRTGACAGWWSASPTRGCRPLTPP